MRYYEIVNCSNSEPTFVNEGRDAPLYHGTSFKSALRIIKNNEIAAVTTHDRTILAISKRSARDNQDEPVHGVSLSRNKEIAFGFGYVVFEIDQRRLTQTNRLLPIDFWAADDPRSKIPSRRGPNQNPNVEKYEYEEFCVGSIKPLNRFLKAIYLTERGRSKLYQAYPDSPLIDHPLLKITKLKG